jgi:hypothetical protein
MSQKYNSTWGSLSHQLMVLTGPDKPNWLSLGKDVWLIIIQKLKKHERIIICPKVCRKFKIWIKVDIYEVLWMRRHNCDLKVCQKKKPIIQKIVQTHLNLQKNVSEVIFGSTCKRLQRFRPECRQSNKQKYSRSHHQNKKRKPRPKAPTKLFECLNNEENINLCSMCGDNITFKDEYSNTCNFCLYTYVYDELYNDYADDYADVWDDDWCPDNHWLN